MNTPKLFLTALASTFLLMSCSNDDDNNSNNPQGTYDNGILVVNEGSSGAGSISFIADDFHTTEQSIYQTVNPNDDLGQFVQSMFFEDDLAFIISNGSNLITVVNRYTFELVTKIDSGLDVPYYGVAEDGKAYVTNLATFSSGEDDYVAVIDLETYEVENTVTIGDYAATIEEENGKLYIQNSNYGTGTSISVMNIASEQIENVITTAEGLNSFEIENGNLYALSASSLQEFNLGSGELTKEISLTYGTEEETLFANNLAIEDGKIYFTVANSVYQLGLGDTTAPTEALLSYETTSEFGVMYGFEVEDNRIFIADGGDFASDSFVKIYDTEGNLLTTQAVGVAPNGFYENE